MSTLQCYAPTFNKKIQISPTGGALSVDGGLPLVKEFMHKSHFTELLNETVRFDDKRKRIIHSHTSTFEQLILQQIAGYDKADAADVLAHNQLFTKLLSKERLASQPTISRKLKDVTTETIQELSLLNQCYLDQYYRQKSINTVVIDVDSTHFDTFGKQESSDFNAHYQTFGYHPLVAFDALTGIFLGAQLRSGNVYISTDVVGFLELIIKHFLDDLHVQTILIRGDSGFAVPELYELCERYYDSFDYRAAKWKKERTVILQNERPAGEILFSPIFIVTNMEDLIPETIIKMYKNRGLMENFIKEAKLGFFMDKTDSSKFVTNEACMWIGALSYNIIQLMKCWIFSKPMKTWTIGTIRQRIIKISTKVISHSGRSLLKLDETFVYLNDYFSVVKRLKSF